MHVNKSYSWLIKPVNWFWFIYYYLIVYIWMERVGERVKERGRDNNQNILKLVNFMNILLYTTLPHSTMGSDTICYINSSIKGSLRCYLPNKWYQSTWCCAARWQNYESSFRRWSRSMVPFTVGVGKGCVYLEPTQVYITQVKPNKSPHNDQSWKKT